MDEEEPELAALDISGHVGLSGAPSSVQDALDGAMRDRNTLQDNIRAVRAACTDLETSREVKLVSCLFEATNV